MEQNPLVKLVEGNSWLRLSRFGGAMRFHWIKKSKIALTLALVMLVVAAVEMGLALLDVDSYRLGTQMPDLPFALALVFCCAIATAGKESTFLLRFGTPRTSVWLSNVLSLFLVGAGYLLLSVVVNAIVGTAALALAGSCSDIHIPARYDLPIFQYQVLMLRDAVEAMPWYLLWLLEYTCIFYLLGCCLRRWKVATILVLVGVPALLFSMLLLPMLEDAFAALENGGESQLMVMVIQNIDWDDKIGRFIEENWQWVQGGVALVSLVLSYLVMRGTRQPD